MSDAENLEQAYPYLHEKYGDTSTLAPPLTMLSRQRHGFGRDSKSINCEHLTPSPYLMVHYAWDFLSTTEKITMGEEVSPYFSAYANMRQKAVTEDIAPIRKQHEKATAVELLTPVDNRRAYLLAIALMRFDYTYAHLIRWLGGTYTYEHRNFDAVFDIIERAKRWPVPAGL